MIDYKITPMEAKYLDQVEALEQMCFSVPWSRHSLENELSKKESCMLAALLNHGVVGYASFSWVLDEGYIGNVAVHPDCRRMGLGRALVERMLQEAKSLGLSTLSLEVRPSNTAAIALYTSLGFEEAGWRKSYYQQPPEDALILTHPFI